MRPHRLRVTAFGAFGGTVEVSFDDLGSHGLFLLHGETGAGKTTLLDAIGFALYGRVPGERGKARRLRSDHAPVGTRTEVLLEATIGGRRVRITRRPEQDRPKLRGGGTTTEQAKVLLEEACGGSWRAVSTRAGEADEEIRDLMGMSAEQFFQVVLLPQGKFADFLHADAGDRARLLQRLFGTDRFRAVEEWLAERRRATAREVDEAEGAIRELVARVAQVAQVTGTQGEPDPVPAPRPGESVLPIPRSGEFPGCPSRAPQSPDCPRHAAASPRYPTRPGPRAWPRRAAAEAAACAAQVRAHRSALDQAQDRLRAAERVADRQRRRSDALQTRDQIDQDAPGIEELSGDLAAALRGAEVTPALDQAERTAAVLADARDAETRARAAVALLPNARPQATAAELRADAQRHVTNSGRLDGLRSLAEQAAQEDQTAASARTSAAAWAAQIDAAKGEAAARREQRPGLSRQRDQAREAAERLPTAAAEADRHERAAADMAALLEARADKADQSEAYITAKIEHAGLMNEAARLRMARIDGMRAELAAVLVDGTPCPVCGSLDHPELCEIQGERVTREQEEAADAEAADAGERAETIGAKLGAALERVTDLTARLQAAGFTVAADQASLAADARRLAATSRELKAEAAGWPPSACPTRRPLSRTSTSRSPRPISASSN